MGNVLRKNRVQAVDSIRGLIIVLMILEHSRQVLTGVIITESPYIPFDHSLSIDALVIRSLSHLCAPGFFFLLGVSAVLATHKKTYNIIKHGIILIFLQLTVINFAWAIQAYLKSGYYIGEAPLFYFGVLSTLGCVLIITGIIKNFSPLIIFLITILMYIPVSIIDKPNNLIVGALFTGYWGRSVEISYPLLPWLTVALLGAAFTKYIVIDSGEKFRKVQTKRLAVFLAVTWGSLLTFILLNGIEHFHKYPPSLLFIAITTITIISLIALFITFPIINLAWLRTLGRHSLVVYILHLYFLSFTISIFPGKSFLQILGTAIVITSLCLLCIYIYEIGPFFTKHSKIFDATSSIYDRIMEYFSFDHQVKLNKTFLKKSDNRLLDIAGGTGRITSQFKSHFSLSVVVDISLPMIKIASNRGLTGVQASAQRLPFSNDSFSTVLCTDALHHIKNFEHTIGEMRRILMPNGYVVIQEFHIKGLKGLCLLLFEHLFIDRSKFISPLELEELMEKYDFKGTTRPISKIAYVYEGVLTSKEI